MNAANPIFAGIERLAERYDPNARAFEAFSMSASGTRLLDPFGATTLAEALDEVTRRWCWDRGDRFAVREIGEGVDRLHIYAVRRKSRGTKAWQDYVPVVEHERWIEHICTIDVNVIAGKPVGLLGVEINLHARRQRARPEGAAL